MTSDVVVVGAGISGAYTAYLLARAGLRVQIIERADIRQQASACNPGGINPLHGPGIPGPLLDFALHCHRLHRTHWDAITATAGMDFAPQAVSRLEVALDDADVAALEPSFQLYSDSEGFAAERLNRTEALQLEPGLPATISGALLLHGNAMVDSEAYTRALATAAERLGAVSVADTVVSVDTADQQVTHVRTTRARIACAAVVFATGAWSADIGGWLNVRMPVRPVKGELLQVRLAGRPALRHHILRRMMGLYRMANGDIMLGGSQEDIGFDATPTAAARQRILDTAAGIYPAIRQATLVRQLVAFRPVAADNYPVVGRLPDWDNAYVATGGGTKGVLVSAGMAEAITASLTGEAIDPCLRVCSPDRFSNRNLPASPA